MNADIPNSGYIPITRTNAGTIGKGIYAQNSPRLYQFSYLTDTSIVL